MKEKEYKKYTQQETWFHGTTLSGWKNICSQGVKVDYNLGSELDFGYGFYLTPKYNQAESYITRMMPYLDSENEDDKIPVVIEFEIDFSKLDDYKHTVFLHFDEEFAEFVLKNRTNPDKRVHDFDYVIGVMTDSNHDKLIAEYRIGTLTKQEVLQGLTKWTSVVQASLHNQNICDILRVKKATLVDSGKELNADDYNKSK